MFKDVAVTEQVGSCRGVSDKSQEKVGWVCKQYHIVKDQCWFDE